MTQRSRRSRRRRSKRDQPVDLSRYRAFIPEWDRFVAAASRPEPTVFRVRAGRVSETEVAERLTEAGFTTGGLDGMPGFREVLAAERPISRTFEHWAGHIYVQQASTGVVAPLLDVEVGDRVLDLCAAPGGKTTHIAELLGGTGCVVANEVSEPRIRGLLGNIYRLGHTNVVVCAGDGRRLPESALFDRVLVDAPCSGEGTLRRSGGAAPRQSKSFLRYVTTTQRALLEKAVRVTRPGGIILYVTCTFAPEENEAVVSRALQELPVDLVPVRLPVPHAGGVLDFEGTSFDARLEGAARIYPHHFDSGGLFITKLVRLEDGSGGSSGGSPDAGWSVVPPTYQDRAPDSASHVAAAAPGDGEPGAWVDVVRGMAERFGMEAWLSRHRSLLRGGKVWTHTVEEWPIDLWEEGAWRLISAGVRGVDFDSRGRARPTNDLLRMAGTNATERWVDVTDDELDRLLVGEPVPTSIDARGPIALRWRGHTCGRGAVTRDGLKSEIPRARAADLLRVRTDSSSQSPDP